NGVAELEAALRAQRALRTHLDAALAAMHDGFLVLRAVRDDDGAVRDFAVVEINDAARAILCAPEDTACDAAELTLRALAPSTERAGLLRICREVIASGQRYDVEHHARRPHHGP